MQATEGNLSLISGGFGPIATKATLKFLIDLTAPYGTVFGLSGKQFAGSS